MIDLSSIPKNFDGSKQVAFNGKDLEGFIYQNINTVKLTLDGYYAGHWFFTYQILVEMGIRDFKIIN